mmetsp:Transcript_42970/g.104028  ORF Transcript_42970/g.104028 Transcript_42970/m.104028 type:complete len:81 (+) Transcript_42970:1600-1842(+)
MHPDKFQRESKQQRHGMLPILVPQIVQIQLNKNAFVTDHILNCICTTIVPLFTYHDLPSRSHPGTMLRKSRHRRSAEYAY